jgi:hypothetical protein
MTSIGLCPNDIVRRKRPVVLVDFLYYGSTMEIIFYLLRFWCEEKGYDWASAKKKIHVITIEVLEDKEEQKLK